ncbi:hypothetical protein M514_01249 [Trichuris suis]|uniref:Secreted protein n=1 Tax=Trichuris suis TaxID=68888 RepID=A0A085NMV2_9BILA|nr:hypothetical protein M513_01249 [Trichuris suis]KFD70798.1 hypothetical protein M514_01249 [Trichuris suis]
MVCGSDLRVFCPSILILVFLDGVCPLLRCEVVLVLADGCLPAEVRHLYDPGDCVHHSDEEQRADSRTLMYSYRDWEGLRLPCASLYACPIHLSDRCDDEESSTVTDSQ